MGDGLRALLSPSPTAGVLSRFWSASPPSLSLGGAPPSAVGALGGGSSRLPSLAAAAPASLAGSGNGDGFGAQSESFLSGGVSSSGHDIFVTYPDVLDKLCCGMVNGGVKFCTLGVEHCSYSTHSKKVQVLPNHIYIKEGPKAAFTYHKIPAAQFSVDQLHQFLGETRPLDAWAALFSSINGQQASAVIQSVATPAKKRKQRYATEDEDSEGLGFELRELLDFLASLCTNSQDFETIMSPSVLMKFFDSTVMILQKLTARSNSLSFHVGEDLDTVSQQYSSLVGVVGSKPRQLESSTADLLSGPTLWEGLQALVAALETNHSIHMRFHSVFKS
jgi:hypothetical protein